MQEWVRKKENYEKDNEYCLYGVPTSENSHFIFHNYNHSDNFSRVFIHSSFHPINNTDSFVGTNYFDLILVENYPFVAETIKSKNLTTQALGNDKFKKS